MVNYVNTVLVSNLASGAVATYAQATADTTGINTVSPAAGKFVVINCDPNLDAVNGDIFDVTAANAANAQTIKVGIVTKKNQAVRVRDAQGNYSTEYKPIIKWSNEIKAADIKSYNILSWKQDTEDTINIDFSKMNDAMAMDSGLIKPDIRFVIRLTFKDMPHRYRKWTESYEYSANGTETPSDIADAFANIITNEYKRARVEAVSASGVLTLTALPYDDDDSVDSLNWANKVRFNANIYYTDPSADGWESLNKYFPAGVKIKKIPGEQYPASAKLVRDRESWAMGYQGILNRGEGTWPIIKPEMETDLSAQYDAITLEFENMYRAADDIQRKTKQVLEIYGKKNQLTPVKNILDAFVSGTQQDEVTNPKL